MARLRIIAINLSTWFARREKVVFSKHRSIWHENRRTVRLRAILKHVTSKTSLAAGAGLWAAALCAAGSAWGAQCLGVQFPEHLQLQGTSLSLNGLGVRKATFLKINVYVAALYVPRRTPDAHAIIDSDRPFELDLQFVRGVGAKAIRDGFDEGFAQSASGNAALKSRIATLEGWIEDIRAGERMSFVGVPGGGVQFSFAGKLKGTLEGEDFTRALLAIWFGGHPPNPELKTGLLGGPCR
jgi:hypothetical protein